MRQWLRDRPWIWIVLLMALLVAGSIATLVIAELNRPEILKRSAVDSGEGSRAKRSVSTASPSTGQDR